MGDRCVADIAGILGEPGGFLDKEGKLHAECSCSVVRGPPVVERRFAYSNCLLLCVALFVCLTFLCVLRTSHGCALDVLLKHPGAFTYTPELNVLPIVRTASKAAHSEF